MNQTNATNPQKYVFRFAKSVKDVSLSIQSSPILSSPGASDEENRPIHEPFCTDVTPEKILPVDRTTKCHVWSCWANRKYEMQTMLSEKDDLACPAHADSAE